MIDLTFIGLTAGAFTTIGFGPQIVKGIRTKKMQDVSLTMPVLLTVGMLLWIIYGFVLNDLPIIMWNSIAVVLNLGIIGLKLSYGRKSSSSLS